MNRHIVFVAGKKFVLLSEDSNEYVEKLAKEVGTSINRISEVNPQMESRSCAILCALDYADDKYKEIERCQRLSDQAKKVMEQADKHAKQITDLKAQISKRDAEIVKLKAELEDLKKKSEIAKIEKPQQKLQEKPEKTASEKKEQKPLPRKKEKKHSHPHVNPYKAQAQETPSADEDAQGEQPKGYVPMRQISLFENE